VKFCSWKLIKLLVSKRPSQLKNNLTCLSITLFNYTRKNLKNIKKGGKMAGNIQTGKISIILTYSDKIPYKIEDFNDMIKSIFSQSYKNFEVILTDKRGESAKPDYLEDKIKNNKKFVYLPINFKNRANAINQAIDKSKGKFILLINNESAPVFLKKSALNTFVMAMNLNKKAGMVYSDYELITDGSVREIHLLDYHRGRLMDSVDFGRAICYSKKVLESVGKLTEKYNVADLYDLRLKVSEKYDLVLISNRYNGSLYSAVAQAVGHNVFDYLLASKQTQLEMEDAVTEHLKRTGAYLAPGANHHKVVYTEKEEQQFKDCIATVVIPVNNRPEFISTAIESVQNQTIKNIEVIVVVNGGPQDPTNKVVKQYMKGGVKYDPSKPPVSLITLDVNNIGLCLNMGINEARGKYYVQLDSDDRLKPNAVEKIVKTFDSDPTAAMVIGSYEVWQKDEVTEEIKRKEDIPVVTHDEWTFGNGRNNLLRINGAGAPRSAHIKIMKELGWFGMNDSPFSRNYGEDYDFVHRAAEQYNIGRVWEPIYDVIRHKGGTDHSIDQQTIDRNNNAKDYMRLEAILRRQKINKQLSKNK